MARCGCTAASSGGGACGCTITAGEGITVTQVGDEYIISADTESPGNETDEILTCDDARACLSAGTDMAFDQSTGVMDVVGDRGGWPAQLFTGASPVTGGEGGGRWARVGPLLHFRIRIDVATNATFPTTDPLAITLPFNAAPTFDTVIQLQAFNDTATPNFLAGVGLIFPNQAQVARLLVDDSGAGGDLDNATRTTPVDWRGWTFRVSGVYELAP